MVQQIVWLITGTSSGFGHELTLSALRRGDKVIATTRARSLAKLAVLKQAGADVLELDATEPLETLHDVAKKAIAIHGRVDVLVNNAGYIETGPLEENTPKETFDQFNTNVFGPLNVNRAFLPYMRQQKSGTIVWLGSIGGWRGASCAGLYSATKHAVRALAQSLDMEISPLGLRSICIEPGYFRTDFLTADNRGAQKSRIPDYQQASQEAYARLQGYNGKQPGDPKKGAEIIVDIVRHEGQAAERPTPSVVAIGSDSYGIIKGALEEALERLEGWKDVTISTDLPKDV